MCACVRVCGMVKRELRMCYDENWELKGRTQWQVFSVVMSFHVSRGECLYTWCSKLKVAVINGMSGAKPVCKGVCLCSTLIVIILPTLQSVCEKWTI